MIDEDGNVQTVCDQPVFGIIKDLAVLPWNEKFRARRPPQVCWLFVKLTVFLVYISAVSIVEFLTKKDEARSINLR